MPRENRVPFPCGKCRFRDPERDECFRNPPDGSGKRPPVTVNDPGCFAGEPDNPSLVICTELDGTKVGATLAKDYPGIKDYFGKTVRVVIMEV